MTQYQKPTVVPAWGEDKVGIPADMLQPADADIKIGWPQSNLPPPRQKFNWLENWLSNGLRYFMQRGLVDWAANETYAIGARVIGDDGKTYKSLTANTNQQPSTNPDDWELWAFSLSELVAKAVAITALTGSAKLPVGTTAQRDAAPESGYSRYNSTLDRAEVYSALKGWSAMGGGATGGGADEIFFLGGQHMTQNFTIPANKNALAITPLEIDPGVELEFGAGSTLTLV